MRDYDVGMYPLQLTTDGIKFLYRLLLIKYPKFTDITTGISDIPKYSDDNDLYTYDVDVSQYSEVQEIQNRMYSEKR